MGRSGEVGNGPASTYVKLMAPPGVKSMPMRSTGSYPQQEVVRKGSEAARQSPSRGGAAGPAGSPRARKHRTHVEPLQPLTPTPYSYASGSPKRERRRRRQHRSRSRSPVPTGSVKSPAPRPLEGTYKSPSPPRRAYATLPPEGDRDQSPSRHRQHRETDSPRKRHRRRSSSPRTRSPQTPDRRGGLFSTMRRHQEHQRQRDDVPSSAALPGYDPNDAAPEDRFQPCDVVQLDSIASKRRVPSDWGQHAHVVAVTMMLQGVSFAQYVKARREAPDAADRFERALKWDIIAHVGGAAREEDVVLGLAPGQIHAVRLALDEADDRDRERGPSVSQASHHSWTTQPRQPTDESTIRLASSDWPIMIEMLLRAKDTDRQARAASYLYHALLPGGEGLPLEHTPRAYIKHLDKSPDVDPQKIALVRAPPADPPHQPPGDPQPRQQLSSPYQPPFLQPSSHTHQPLLAPPRQPQQAMAVQPQSPQVPAAFHGQHSPEAQPQHPPPVRMATSPTMAVHTQQSPQVARAAQPQPSPQAPVVVPSGRPTLSPSRHAAGPDHVVAPPSTPPRVSLVPDARSLPLSPAVTSPPSAVPLQRSGARPPPRPSYAPPSPALATTTTVPVDRPVYDSPQTQMPRTGYGEEGRFDHIKSPPSGATFRAGSSPMTTPSRPTSLSKKHASGSGLLEHHTANPMPRQPAGPETLAPSRPTGSNPAASLTPFPKHHGAYGGYQA